MTERKKAINRMRYALLILFTLSSFGLSGADSWSINWSTIDSGGAMASTGDVWKLSGTVGQPDATPPAQLSGNGWSLTGGFWNASLLLRELIFKDGFEN